MYKFLFFFVGLFFSIKGYAQFNPSYADAGMWSTVSLDYALNKKWTILAAEEFRMRENYSRVNLFYTNLGLEYAPNKYIKTALVYRFIDKVLDDNSIGFRHRLMWDITFRYKIRKIALSYRHRLQMEYRNIFSTETGFMPEWYDRSKFEIAYQLQKKWSIYGATELRYQIHDVRNEVSENTFHRIRYQAGIDYRINKYSKLGVYYLIQRVFNVTNYEHLYITGIEYSASLQDSPLFQKKKSK